MELHFAGGLRANQEALSRAQVILEHAMEIAASMQGSIEARTW